MKYLSLMLPLIAGAIALPAAAQDPIDSQCSASATQATGYTPGSSSGAQPGARVAGAARGAAAGATVGAVQGNQHDNAPAGMKDAHQENQAKSGAAAGMAVAGSRNRQARRSDRNSGDAWQISYDTCMAAKPK